MKMRKLLKKHRQNKLKKFLNMWFTNGLNPMKTKKQEYDISWQMRLKYPAQVAFYAW